MQDKILIISPSGKLYGSESVLIDYLTHTSLQPDVLVPANSDLEKKVKLLNRGFKIIPYRSDRLKQLYLKLCLALLLGKYDTVYINEAGHVKYILLLAKLFPNRQFRVHIRLIEDIALERWTQVKTTLPPNVEIISISSFISEKIPFPNVMIPDPFIFENNELKSPSYSRGDIFNIGIIGRLTLSKGIELLPLLLTEIKNSNLAFNCKVHLFGESGNDVPDLIMNQIDNSDIVVHHGYVKGAEYIYSKLHAVVHLSKVEPLGRIFFESVNYVLPFLGIKAGGIGEIAHEYGYEELMIVDGSPEAITKDFQEKLVLLSGNYERYKAEVLKVKKSMRERMTINNYCLQMDHILSKNN